MAQKTVNWKMRQRQGTSAEWESKNPVLAAGEFGYDTTNDKLKIGDGKTAWNSLPTFTTTRFSFGSASWGDIAQIAAAGTAKKFFNVGDEKVITLSTGEEVTLVILGFDHDDIAGGGKAPITIGMKNCLSTTYSMNGSNTNAGGWENSTMRKNVMATLLSQLPSDLQKVIKTVNKPASAGSQSTDITVSTDKLWLLSPVEIMGTEVAPTNAAPYNQEGAQYEYYKTVKDGAGTGATANPDRIKHLSNGGGAACPWWLRSPFAANATYFMNVNSAGNVRYGVASNAFGVSFGFCL